MTRENFTSSDTSRRHAGRPAPRPRIVLAESEHARLVKLTESAMKHGSPVAEYLSDELSRAHIVPDADCASNVVRIGSQVTYSDEATGRTRKVTVVWPEAADIDRNRISVLTPVGAALMGLSPAQTIDWPTPGGGSGTLTVLDVRNEDSEAGSG